MFTPEERASLRAELLAKSTGDPRITGAAITGSGAADGEDRWSDIDLAFGIEDSTQMGAILSDWTEFMYARHKALHHFDVKAAGWIYRVFLLSSTLQVDLAFVATAEFRPLAASFRLVSGEAQEAQSFPKPVVEDLIGMGWLYALHVRSCIARGNRWQAEYMISGMRDTALALACIRCGHPAIHGRGFDLLPEEVLSRYQGSLVRDLADAELQRVLRVVTEALLWEIRSVDQELGHRLENPLKEICNPWGTRSVSGVK
jgi:hypothetical protein